MPAVQAVLWVTRQYQMPRGPTIEACAYLARPSRSGPDRWTLPLPTGRALRSPAPSRSGSLALTTAAVAVLEVAAIGIEDASPVYLVAVVAVGRDRRHDAGGAHRHRRIPAATTSSSPSPRFSLRRRRSARVARPGAVPVRRRSSIGRLVAIQHARADEAARRARRGERALLAQPLARDGDVHRRCRAPRSPARVRAAAGCDRVWILAGPPSAERLARRHRQRPAATRRRASRHRSPGRPATSRPAGCARTAGDRRPGPGGDRRSPVPRPDRGRRRPARDARRRRAIARTASRRGSRPASSRSPPTRSRVSLRRDQLRQTATELEVARQTDVLKTALIDSVSHDLRTPLASIRATAGGLADPEVDWTDEARARAADADRREAARLDRLVGGVLDLSRIEVGRDPSRPRAARARGPCRAGVDRMRPSLGPAPVTVDIPHDLPPVLATPRCWTSSSPTSSRTSRRTRRPTPPWRSAPRSRRDRSVELVVEDGGPRRPAPTSCRRCSSASTAVARPRGLATRAGHRARVVRGLTEAMGGTVSAARGVGAGGAADPHARSGDAAAGRGPRRAVTTRPAPALRGRRGGGPRAVARNLARATGSASRRAATADDGLRRWDADRAGRDPARPRAARPRRRRPSSATCASESTTPILVISARSQERGQGRARSRSAPTTTSPSRSAWTSCARGWRPLLRRAGGAGADQAGIVRSGRSARSSDPARRRSTATPVRPHAARVRAAEDDDRAAGPAADEGPAPARGLGLGLRATRATTSTSTSAALPAQARRRRPDRARRAA